MRRRLSGGLAAAGSLAALVLGMAAMDERVREAARRVVSGEGASPEMVSSAHRLQEAVFVAIDAVRDQSIDHAPLTIFALVATVLLLFMLRT